MPEKKGSYSGYTKSRKEANERYLKKFVQLPLRVTEAERDEINSHAAIYDKSTAAFLKRAIKETMIRDKNQMR